MKETLSSERTPDVSGWKETLEALASAHQEVIQNKNNSEKMAAFSAAWKKAFDEAATTDEMGELIHHVPNTEDQNKLKEKWDRLSEEEESKLVGTHDLQALKHAYDNAPFDEHQGVALQKLVDEINDEKVARSFHNKSAPGSNLSMALEKKFPTLLGKREKMKEEDADEEGCLYDIEDEENESPEEQNKKTETLIQRIRKTLGLK